MISVVKVLINFCGRKVLMVNRRAPLINLPCLRLALNLSKGRSNVQSKWVSVPGSWLLIKMPVLCLKTSTCIDICFLLLC